MVEFHKDSPSVQVSVTQRQVTVMPDPEPLIIVGSSARAAAQSAARSGFRPWCIDQFGDQDLIETPATSHVVRNWPAEISSVFQQSPPAEWIYTGALENQPEIVDQLSQLRTLRGCERATLNRIRNPQWLMKTLISASILGLPILLPTTGMPPADVQQPGQWMVKPLTSAAGIGVSELTLDGSGGVCPDGHYLQRKVAGPVLSGLFLADRNSTRLLGLSAQQCRGLDAREHRYVYSGSLGPLSRRDVSADVFDQAIGIGSAIQQSLSQEHAEIRGLFGIDFVHDSQTGQLWTLEVNPRYTASAELYELAFDWPLMRWHIDACRGLAVSTPAESDSPRNATDQPMSGKRIVYAERSFIAPELASLLGRVADEVCDDFDSNDSAMRIEIADIPQPGSLIGKDEPVCTLLTSGSNLSSCDEILTGASKRLLLLIDETTG